jgi:hypothetical protein
MQHRVRSAQNDGLNRISNSGNEHQAKLRLDQVDAQIDPPRWNASQVLWWICKGWWNSALWWSFFAFATLMWCLVYAKADDNGELSSTLDFSIYFVRVRFRNHPDCPCNRLISLG